MVALLASIPIQSSFSAVKFSDVPADAWYLQALETITQDSRKILQGYTDGTYKPEKMLDVCEFVKCIIAARGYTLPNGNTYWAENYIRKATDLGYIRKEEFASTTSDPYAGYKRPITRGEMARMVVRALLDAEGDYPYHDEKAIIPLIQDYNDINAAIQPWVIKAYDMGILGGFPDKTFKADKSLSRAEAVAVCLRLIDPSARLKVAVADPTPTPRPGDNQYAATPDAEFEAFMKSAEAEKYITTKYINEVKDGKIYFDTTPSIPQNKPDYSKRILPPSEFNPYINRDVYETTRDLLKLTRKYGGYLYVAYAPVSAKLAWVLVEYFPTKEFYEANDKSGGYFGVYMFTKPYTPYPDKQKEPSKYRWTIGKLCSDEYLNAQGYGKAISEHYKNGTPMDFTKYDYTEDMYEEMLTTMMKSIYGQEQGIKMSIVMINYRIKKLYGTTDPTEIFGYKEEFGGCELAFKMETPPFVFFTSGVKDRK